MSGFIKHKNDEVALLVQIDQLKNMVREADNLEVALRGQIKGLKSKLQEGDSCPVATGEPPADLRYV